MIYRRLGSSILRTVPFLLLVFSCGGHARAEESAARAPAVDFSRDVRSVLSENCFACHGPDAAKRHADLRLDLRDEATRTLESGAAAIVPGKPDESELIRRLVTNDPDQRMPPATTHKTVTAAQVAMLRRWIAEGASYQQHWAFRPPQRPALPETRNTRWVRNPIDRFVLARLEREGLAPSPEADRITLIRRLSLDLIGLPPTIAEVDDFLLDHTPQAYERVVERLLASPHYGERWGRHWLDAARYADTDGYEKDKLRYMFFYRDWVINALNRDLPYKQFLIEQLAGDLLPNRTQDQLVATGFLRNSMINEEGGVDPEQFRMEAMFDRMDALGKSVLGLTIQCAQCHNHKFDPITQEEYYRLFAFLNTDHESMHVVYTPEEQRTIADIMRMKREAEAELKNEMSDWQSRQAEWEQTARADQPDWKIIPLENTGDNGQRYIPQRDGSYLAQSYAPTKFTATFKSTLTAGPVAALRLELLTDPNLPCGGPGRSFKGTCALTDIRVEVATDEDPAKRTPVKIVRATADFEEPNERELEPNFFDKSTNRRVTGPVQLAIDGDAKTAWGIDAGPGQRNTDRKAVFVFEQPIDASSDKPMTLHISLVQMHGGWNSDDLMTNNLGRFRVSVTSDTDATADPLPKRVREALAVSGEQRSEQQRSEIFSYWRTTVPAWADRNAQIAAATSRWPTGATSLTLTARREPRMTSLLKRGDWLKPANPVIAGVPAALNPLATDAPPTRLTLAQWLTDDKAPTTARVFVNRMWQHYFGLGLVTTSEDFGVQCDPPSHPELLDWLANEFMHPSIGTDAAAPWSIKHMHRLIVNSSTYRQSSSVRPELLARDPANRLLARGSRFRVEGEIVRDIALKASGLLNETAGGRSVMPPAPAFLFVQPASYAPFPWIDEQDAQKYRRAIYTLRRRSTPYPVLQAFDVPNGDVSCVRRLRSNSPLQALTTLNEPIFFECAVALAMKALREGGRSDDSRIVFTFRQVVSRPPSAVESRELLDLVRKQRERLERGELKASELLAGAGLAPEKPPSTIALNELAALVAVARVVLNLDEAISHE